MSLPSTSSTRTVAYIVSDQLAKISSLLPSNKGRSMMVHQLVVAFGLLNSHKKAGGTRVILMKPTPAIREELLAFHSEEYIDYVLNPLPPSDSSRTSDGREYGLEEDCPWFKGLQLYVTLVAGAVLTAARVLSERKVEVAIAWDGGRHHAHQSHASGFCYVADLPLALIALKRSSGSIKPRVMYLDLDLHFSDGVSVPFHRPSSTSSAIPSRLLTLSIHHSSPGFFPTHRLASLSTIDGDPFTLSMALKRGTSNATMKRIWESVEKIKEAFEPDILVVQCGVDGLAGDPTGVWNWGLYGEGGMGWCIERVVGWGKRLLLVGGGGYRSSNAARAWTYLTSIALQCPIEPETQIPEHDLWPRYAPGFTMEVEVGSGRDENTDEYLGEVEQVFGGIAERIRDLRG